MVIYVLDRSGLMGLNFGFCAFAKVFDLKIGDYGQTWTNEGKMTRHVKGKLWIVYLKNSQ